MDNAIHIQYMQRWLKNWIDTFLTLFELFMSSATKEFSMDLHSSFSIDESHWGLNSPAISFIKFDFELHIGDVTNNF